MWKKITIPEAIGAMGAIDAISPKLDPAAQYEMACVKQVLERSIELARPIVTGDEKKDQWLMAARTLPFEPLVLKDILQNVGEIDPQTFRYLKKLA